MWQPAEGLGPWVEVEALEVQDRLLRKQHSKALFWRIRNACSRRSVQSLLLGKAVASLQL